MTVGRVHMKFDMQLATNDFYRPCALGFTKPSYGSVITYSDLLNIGSLNYRIVVQNALNFAYFVYVL